DAAGGEHAQARGGDRADEVDVGTGERAVAVDGGAEDQADAGSEAACDRLGEPEAGFLGPAGAAYPAAADVERDDEPLVECLHPPGRVRERGRADDDAAGS